MPDAAEPNSLEEFHAPGTQGERTLIRPIVGHPPFNRGDTFSAAWVRETTGRVVDRVQLAFLADQFAPRSFFWSEGPRPSATLTMTVYLHGTDDEIAASLAAIGALDHFLAFPLGLATEVRERGSRLSAGERQLIALARAALVDPAVLVLDEATSNLDPGTEAEVEHALESLMTDRTVIVVAHRLSTVRRADRIAVVDAGGLAELGSHDELVALGGKYAALSAAWERNQQSGAVLAE